MNDNNRNNGNGNQNQNRNHSTLLIFLVVTLLTLVVMSIFNRMMDDSTSMEITYDQFLDLLEQDLVKSVTVDQDKLTIVTNTQELASQGIETTYYTGRTELRAADPDLDPDGRGDAQDVRLRRHDGRGQEPRQDVHAVRDRRYLQGRGGTG